MTEDEYLRFHYLRYSVLLEAARRAAARMNGLSSVLVVGPSHETRLLAEEFSGAIVNTAGRSDARYLTPRGQHFELDLNRILCAELPRHDLVVMAEVIEHLLLPPEAILAWVREWVRPGGEAVVQTPNAVHLLRRLKMLVGSNPFMPIPLPYNESFHVREYTLDELRAAGERAGLKVADVVRRNYFRHKGWQGKLLLMAGPLMPGGLREGLTVSFTRM